MVASKAARPLAIMLGMCDDAVAPRSRNTHGCDEMADTKATSEGRTLLNTLGRFARSGEFSRLSVKISIATDMSAVEKIPQFRGRETPTAMTVS